MSIQYMSSEGLREATKQEFLTLVQHGVITPTTEVVIDGKRALAKQIKGVVFPVAAVPPAETKSSEGGTVLNTAKQKAFEGAKKAMQVATPVFQKMMAKGKDIGADIAKKATPVMQNALEKGKDIGADIAKKATPVVQNAFEKGKVIGTDVTKKSLPIVQRCVDKCSAIAKRVKRWAIIGTIIVIPLLLLIFCSSWFSGSSTKKIAVNEALQGEIMLDETASVTAEPVEDKKAIEAQRLFEQGRAYAIGHNTPQDKREAYKCYIKAANAGNQGAMVALVDLFFVDFIGLGPIQALSEVQQYTPIESVEASLTLGVFWLNKLADNKDTWAMEHLARAYAFGKGVEPSSEKCLEWLKKATANRDRSLSASNFEFHLLSILNVTIWHVVSQDTKRYEKTLIVLDELAKQEPTGKGDYALGLAFYVGVPKNLYFKPGDEMGILHRDPKRGLKLIERSAKKGYVEGQVMLGEAYIQGHVEGLLPMDIAVPPYSQRPRYIDTNVAKGRYWLNKAIDQNVKPPAAKKGCINYHFCAIMLDSWCMSDCAEMLNEQHAYDVKNWNNSENKKIFP